MTLQTLLTEPGRVDEPQFAQAYHDVLSQVVADGRPVIVRRDGADLAAVVTLEQLEVVREVLSRAKVEQLASQIDWSRVGIGSGMPQEWLDETDNPFEPEAESAP